MSLNRATRTTAPATPLSFFITLLALAALLVGVLAIHSAVTGHDVPTALPSSASVGELAAQAAATSTTPVASESVLASSSAGSAPSDSMWLVLTCVLLLSLVALVLRTALTTATQQLVTTIATTRAIRHASVWPVPRPSLTLLSVRRV